MEGRSRGFFIGLGMLLGVIWGASVATLVTVGLVGLPEEDLTRLIFEMCR